jgi:hypothetical protein
VFNTTFNNISVIKDEVLIIDKTELGDNMRQAQLFEGRSPIILRGRREKGMYYFFSSTF